MTKVTTVGFDLAKTVFQVHGADGEGRVALRRKLRRGFAMHRPMHAKSGNHKSDNLRSVHYKI
jgi:hypothetical protein